MIRSMTGYAARTGEVGEGSGRVSLSVELKSVNSRFLDLAFRLPDELRSLEPALPERIAAKAQRQLEWTAQRTELRQPAHALLKKPTIQELQLVQ